ncbi:protein translocase subunit [Lithohypha guttulata]|uniref:Mitochondrial import inner membrane translocase subunit TIM44 n=1 Tax=Lithohypha guttulata TaxID=1690604 RepID=A0AAN7YA34_9EURO|nr:protein translocase subunit [Lithohypha guttulata]KAK5090942.1 protein translocase subunit [Lithohypha guttulata]
MIATRRIQPSVTRQYVRTLQTVASSQSSQYGRAAAYRRLGESTPLLSCLQQPQQLHLPTTRATTFPLHQSRSLHTTQNLSQQAQPRQEPPSEDVKDPPRPDTDASSKEAKSEGSKTEDEGSAEGSGKKRDEKDAPPPPPHGDKTPWQVFRETFSSGLKESKEWNESTKLLQGEVQEFRESDRVKKVSAAYDSTVGRAGRGAQAAAKAVGTGAAWTWETPVVQGVRKGVNATGRGIEQATRPVRETEAFKAVSEAIDDGSSSRYGGWIEKEERRRRRAAREAKEGFKPTEKMEEDLNAGTNVVIHKDAAWKEAWNNFKESSKLGQSMRTWRSTYEESENPLISTARSITDRISGFFAENETAMVVKKFREMDPNFQMEPFLRDMREYILPEVLDAYVKSDVEVLKTWLSAAQFQVYTALMDQYTKHGLKSDGKILDIRGVDVLNARLLEPGEIPVFIITCRTQEVHCYRNRKTGELAAGTEDRVQQVTYAIGVTRLADDIANPETRGWRLIELQKSARDYI